MQSRIYGFGIATICGLLIATPLAHAAPVGSGTYQMESNGIESCLVATLDNVTKDVFGTSINLADAGTLFCHLHLVGTDQVADCTSTPDPGVLSFSSTSPRDGPPTLPPVGEVRPFVGTADSYSGSLLAPLGAVTITLDGTVIYDGSSLPSPTIPGCPISGGVANFHGMVGVNAFQTESASTGTNVPVNTVATFTDQATGMQRSADIAITFGNVEQRRNRAGHRNLERGR